MLISVSAGRTPINFAPATVVEEVVQNVRMILATPRGTVPLHRGFGLESSTLLDRPVNVVQAMLSTTIIDAIQQGEPRATVQEVQWSGSTVQDGILTPTVLIHINE